MVPQSGIRRIGLLLGGGLLALLILPIVSISLSAQDGGRAVPTVPVSQWADDFDSRDDIAYGVAVDFHDEAVVVGTSPVVKYSEGGEILWTAEYEGVAYDAATDSLADVLVAGTGGLVKYSSDGRRIWSVSGSFVDVAVGFEDRIVALREGSGDVYLYSSNGELLGRLPYGGEPLAVALGPEGRFVAVAGSSGVALYDLANSAKLWAAAAPGQIRDVALDSEGAVIAVGDFGILKYAAGGVREWQELFRGEAYAVTTLSRRLPEGDRLFPPGDDILVTGGIRTGGDWDFLTAKYTADGDLLWEARYDGGFGDDLAFGIATSSRGLIYVTGTTTLPAESGTTRSAQRVDQDYYTVQYVEKPLPEVVAGSEPACPAGRTPPVADFEVVPSTAWVEEFLEMRNQSFDPDGYLMAWSWDFGDGTTSAEWEPVHAYGRPGLYTITLTVVDNDYCVATATQEVEVGVGSRAPEVSFRWEAEARAELQADFAWTVNREVYGAYPPGFAPAEPTDLDDIVFEDRSISSGSGGIIHFRGEAVDPDGRVVIWAWDFGDGSTLCCDEPNPTHEYSSPGDYLVTLSVTDDDGLTSVYEDVVSVRSVGGTLVAWEWDFGDGGTSAEQHPVHHYRDDGVYTVTLTVYDDLGNSVSATKSITVINVPPVADFSWTLLGLDGLIPTCADFGLPMQDLQFGYGTACGEPAASDAGPVDFLDLSFDSESWFDLVGREWVFVGGVAVCALAPGCELEPTPQVLFFSDEAQTFLLRGSVEVTLSVTDDDGATAQTTKTVEIGNVPPYAVFDWWTEFGGPALATRGTPYSQRQFGGFAVTDCESCAALYGTGEPEKSASSGDGALTVTRTIYSECDFAGGAGPQAICGIWSTFYVEVTISGTVPDVFVMGESVPSGWQITYCNDPSEALTCGTDSISGFVNISGSFTFSYEVSPAWDTGNVTFGEHTISGTYASGHRIVSLSSTVILCELVDASALVSFWAYDDVDAQDLLGLPGIDLNGDLILSYDWDFGAFGTAAGQEPDGGPCGLTGFPGECEFLLDDLTCAFDGIDWIWSYDLAVTLTVTDEAGGTTQASTTIPLSGPCGGFFGGA